MTKPPACYLPKYCFTIAPGHGDVVCIERGSTGYYPMRGLTLAQADAKNAQLGVSPAMRESMTAGSMFGWDVPAADPAMAEERYPFAHALDINGSTAKAMNASGAFSPFTVIPGGRK